MQTALSGVSNPVPHLTKPAGHWAPSRGRIPVSYELADAADQVCAGYPLLRAQILLLSKTLTRCRAIEPVFAQPAAMRASVHGVIVEMNPNAAAVAPQAQDDSRPPHGKETSV